jgi:hypothetical protein
MQDKLDLAIGHNLINNGTSDDYYTPPAIFQALGVEFDIDVSAPFGGVSWIPARSSYSVIDDGLSQEWIGKVWMNPPFSGVTLWMNKFLDHGNGICLVNFAKSRWMDRLWSEAEAMLLLPSYHKFITAEGEYKGILMPCVMVAAGAEMVAALKNSGLGFIR